jgi:threonine aldolase
MITDLRSDTFTKPGPEMLEAMFKAPVGDDVFGEDPSVNQLESMTADMFGMQAALFCPSGTMTNQIAIKCHTQPGDEVICEQQSHIYIYMKVAALLLTAAAR